MVQVALWHNTAKLAHDCSSYLLSFYPHRINKEITVVGRNPAASDIFLDSNKNKVMISRLHARIITEKNETGKHAFRISDTSLNGTYVNDTKIADTCDLHPGDTVTFGHLRGAVLNAGTLAQQPESEFRFTVSGGQMVQNDYTVISYSALNLWEKQIKIGNFDVVEN